MENARRKRRTISIDDRVAAAKAKVEKIKFRYDRAIAELRKVMDERDECRKREVLDAIGKSKRTYDAAVQPVHLRGGVHRREDEMSIPE